MAHSRVRLEAWIAGTKGTEGITVVFGVHGSQEVGGAFVVGFGLLSTPVHIQTVAKAAEHAHDPY